MKPFFLFLLLLLFSKNAVAVDAPPDSLAIKIGQMVMVGFRGLSTDESPSIRADIRERGLGGVVLFDYDVPSKSTVRNIQSPDQVTKLNRDLQALSQIPLFIAVDQEGGRVSRLKPARGFAPSVTAESLGRLDNPDSTRIAAGITARQLSALQFTMNFAPVVDLNTNPDNPVIGRLGRSFSDDPKVVAHHARLVAERLRESGIIAVLKHFPGHGSSTTDTHRDFTDITGSWSERELDPYRAFIRENYHDAIMTAHVFHAGLDNTFPATLSYEIITKLLRMKLGFRGVVISDDMQMKAIADHYGFETAIRRAVEAGVDILLFANNTTFDPEIATRATGVIRRLVEGGIIPEQRIDESFDRIMKLKQRSLSR